MTVNEITDLLKSIKKSERKVERAATKLDEAKAELAEAKKGLKAALSDEVDAEAA